LAAAARWLLRSGAGTAQERWKIVGFGSVALAAALAYQWVYVESALRRTRTAPEPSPAQVISAYHATPRVELPVSIDDPHLGPLDAPVQLVLFASFPCRACRSFAPILSRVQRQFGDRLLVVFKHYPLSGRCNGRLTVDKQPGACALAWAAEAAHRQGQFWPFHDAVFASGAEAGESSIARTVMELRLDPVRFEADRRSDDVVDRVAADVELGNRLQIPGTPALFLDGRPIRPSGATTLAMLIRHELESAGARSASADGIDHRANRVGADHSGLTKAVVYHDRPAP
jgi:protein-disulfide isomerase